MFTTRCRTEDIKTCTEDIKLLKEIHISSQLQKVISLWPQRRCYFILLRNVYLPKRMELRLGSWALYCKETISFCSSLALLYYKFFSVLTVCHSSSCSSNFGLCSALKTSFMVFVVDRSNQLCIRVGVV